MTNPTECLQPRAFAGSVSPVRPEISAVSLEHVRDRYAELRRVATCLYPDRDDPMVLSELFVVLRQMSTLEQQFTRSELRRNGSHRSPGAPVGGGV